ncbi:MAG: helix-turn-helix domain-containing protein [Limisphaerales bacterium]
MSQTLRWHPESVRRAIRAGRIKAIKIGRHWRVPGAELERLMEEGL